MNTPREPLAPVRAVAEKPRLSPPEAVEYLERQHGVRIAAVTLMNLRSKGGGPAFRKFGARVLYDIECLDDWAIAKLGGRRASTSDSSAH